MDGNYVIPSLVDCRIYESRRQYLSSEPESLGFVNRFSITVHLRSYIATVMTRTFGAKLLSCCASRLCNHIFFSQGSFLRHEYGEEKFVRRRYLESIIADLVPN